MPTVAEILESLASIANERVGLAVAWHVVLLIGLLALGLGWRPSTRLARSVLVLPLASVGVLGFAYGNPFNGFVFAVLSVALLVVGLRAEPAPVHLGPSWAVAASVPLIALGWAYPHFLEPRPAFAYLHSAPLGLIPCPTLSAVIGLALLGGGLGSSGWSLILVTSGLFYGFSGVAQLGVWLDLGLLVGAFALLACIARRGRPRDAASGGRSNEHAAAPTSARRRGRRRARRRGRRRRR